MPLTLLTWNLGYSGLGKESEFVADGGRKYRVDDAALPHRWTREIARFAGARDEDALLFQETAKASWINHGSDLWGALRTATPGRLQTYAREFRIPLPFNAGAETGCAIFHKPLEGVTSGLRRLPGDTASLIRQFPAQILRFEAGAPFTAINAHLSAFDAGARLRSRQIEMLLAIAAEEHRAGRHVVIGGDFNYELAPPRRAHTTDPKHMTWLHPFPLSALPSGWQIAADPRVPTFRSGNKAYVPGENYCGVIDGFIVSPNIRVQNVEGIDLGFEASDHNPVRIEVEAV